MVAIERSAVLCFVVFDDLFASDVEYGSYISAHRVFREQGEASVASLYPKNADDIDDGIPD